MAWLNDRLEAPAEQVGPERARAVMRRVGPAFIFGERRPVDSVRDDTVAGVRVRRYAPAGARDGVIVYFHGGGWVVGDLDSHDHVCRALSLEAGREVVAVDYRLAPEHREPAALEDCLAVTRALAGAHRRVAVAGDSAGGGLAAVVAQRLAAEERILAAQLLIYPVTDCGAESPSYETWAAGPLLTRATMRYFINEYVPEVSRRQHPDVSPLRATSLTGLPPTRVVLAECDVLHDEGRAYADALAAAGVRVEVDEVPGFVHGFLNLQGLDEARTCLQRAARWLSDQLG